MNIERAWDIDETGRMGIEAPKTEAGKRKVHMPPNVLAVLKRH